MGRNDNIEYLSIFINSYFSDGLHTDIFSFPFHQLQVIYDIRLIYPVSLSPAVDTSYMKRGWYPPQIIIKSSAVDNEDEEGLYSSSTVRYNEFILFAVDDPVKNNSTLLNKANILNNSPIYSTVRITMLGRRSLFPSPDLIIIIYGGSNILQRSNISLLPTLKPLWKTVDLPHFFINCGGQFIY